VSKSGLHEALAQAQKAYSAAYCLHPAAPNGCKGRIIKAHSVQRSGALTRLAAQGLVYTLQREPGPELMSQPFPMEPRLVSVSKASTFTGFCGVHDAELFRPIEKQPLRETLEHAFLLHYRSVCREFFSARCALASIAPMKERVRRWPDASRQQLVGSLLSQWEQVVSYNVAQLTAEKQRLDGMLQRADYSNLGCLFISFASVPEIVCSGYFAPEYDMNGKRVQLLDERAERGESVDTIAFSVLPTGADSGAAVLTWLDSMVGSSQFACSLADNGNLDVPNAIVRLIFEYIENAFFAPLWWDNLPSASQRRLMLTFATGTFNRNLRPAEVVHDRLSYVQWNHVRPVRVKN